MQFAKQFGDFCTGFGRFLFEPFEITAELGIRGCRRKYVVAELGMRKFGSVCAVLFSVRKGALEIAHRGNSGDANGIVVWRLHPGFERRLAGVKFNRPCV